MSDLKIIKEVGFIINETEDHLLISHQVHANDFTVGGATLIPKSVIRKRKKLKTGKL